jgi:hypothetical protein
MQTSETYQYSFRGNSPVTAQPYIVPPRYNSVGHIETFFKSIVTIEGPAMISYGKDSRLRLEKDQIAIIKAIPLVDFRTVITHLQEGALNEKSVICTTNTLTDTVLVSHIKNRNHTGSLY